MFNWNALKNPVFERDDWSIKDACFVRDHSDIYLFFSAFYRERGCERSHVVGVKTRDLRSFSPPLFNWDGRRDGWTGMCSPNISKCGAGYILTYNSWGDTHPNGGKNQLFYATSSDLREWSPGRPLGADITADKRVIDAAVARSGSRFYLVWKEEQTPRVAYADRLDGDWTVLGQPSGGWFENAQLLEVDGRWVLLVTGRGPAPYLMTMKGSGEDPHDWLEWSTPRLLEVPGEAFNSDNKANSAFVADWRALDGFFYLLYAGRTEGDTHAGRGDNRLGLARSRDLFRWDIPGHRGMGDRTTSGETQ